MKSIKTIIIALILVLTTLIIIFQIKVEHYKNNLIEHYHFNYLIQSRKHYTPFVIFYLQSKLLKKNKCYFANVHLPYERYDQKQNIVRKQNDNYKLIFNIEYNAYLMYCYYDHSKLNCE